MRFDINNRFTGTVQITAEIECSEDTLYDVKLGLAVKWGVKNGADLSGTYLREAYLSGAYLSGANLSKANLRWANLSEANLSEANLSEANLSEAYLSGADLHRANLSGADLHRANLSGADLSRANLSKANLRWADPIDGGQRSDGYRFIGWIKEGVVQILAGCRSFPIEKAREHWIRTRGGTPLGDETTCIIDHIEQVARIRGLTKREKSDG